MRASIISAMGGETEAATDHSNTSKQGVATDALEDHSKTPQQGIARAAAEDQSKSSKQGMATDGVKDQSRSSKHGAPASDTPGEAEKLTASKSIGNGAVDRKADAADVAACKGSSKVDAAASASATAAGAATDGAGEGTPEGHGEGEKAGKQDKAGSGVCTGGAAREAEEAAAATAPAASPAKAGGSKKKHKGCAKSGKSDALRRRMQSTVPANRSDPPAEKPASPTVPRRLPIRHPSAYAREGTKAPHKAAHDASTMKVADENGSTCASGGKKAPEASRDKRKQKRLYVECKCVTSVSFCKEIILPY